jgi:HEAT repeat protein
MRRIFLILGLLAVMIVVSVLILAFMPRGGAGSRIALIVGWVLAAIASLNALVQLWDYLRPLPITPEKPATPDEKTYLARLLRTFDEAQSAAAALAGDGIIESRFDAYSSTFTAEDTGERLREYRDITQAVRDYKQFVIVGDAGAGKSTYLRQLATAVAHARLAPPKGWLNDLYGKDKPALPLWIYLGDSQNPADANTLVDEWWKKYNLPSNSKNAVTNGDLWLFLDGLNEMPKWEAWAERAASLKAFLAAHPGVRAIITCRQDDYDAALHLGLPVVGVQPLDDARASQFVQKRLGNLVLLDKIARSDALKNIVCNPFRLILLAEVYRDKSQLPADLYDLYRLYALKQYQDRQTHGLDKTDWKSLGSNLERLAFRMIEADKGTIVPTRWAQRQIGWRALREGISLGVLVEDDGNARFYHPCLQGFFALPALTDAIQPHWYDRWQPERRTRSIHAIADLGAGATPAISALIAVMEDEDEEITGWADEALTRIGAPAIPALINAMNGYDEYDTMPWLVAGVLSGMGAPAVSALVDALLEPNDVMRQSAALALGNMPDAAATAVPALVEALQDQNDIVRRSVVQALGNMGEAAAPAVPALMSLLKSGEIDMHLWVAGALRRIGVSPTSVTPLIDILKNADDSVRGLAVVMLERIGAPAVPALIDALKEANEHVRALAVTILMHIGAPAVTPLIETFSKSDGDPRWLAARILGGIGAPAAPAVPVLVAALKDADPMVRIRLELAVAGIGTPEALEALKRTGEKDGGQWKV